MLKVVLSLLVLSFLITSCSAVRRLSSPPRQSEKEAVHADNVGRHSRKSQPIDVQHASGKYSDRMAEDQYYRVHHLSIENSTDLQFKYSIFMNVPVEILANAPLLTYMDEWYGTPYRYGGNSKQGVDCSAFVGGLMSAVFGIHVPRTVREQFAASKRISKDELVEGDLVFFNTTGSVSHVGVYLANDKFVHAATSGGVMISDLNDLYFGRRFAGAGRVR